MADRLHLAAKTTLAAVAAWLIARYGLGHAAPYWAPLAAVIATHPTVTRSILEAARYGAGFGLGVVLAIGSSATIGPNAAGIAVVVFVSLLLGSWGRLGGHAIEIPFAGLFVLLIGGYNVMGYVTPRLIDIAIGLPIGVIINLTVFPPLHLRPASQALQRLAEDIAAILEDMAYGLAEDWPPDNPTWLDRSRALTTVLDGVRRAVHQAGESMQWNPRRVVPRRRARARSSRGAYVALNGLEHIATAVRSMARTLSDAAQRTHTSHDSERDITADYSPAALQDDFRPPFADLLRRAAAMVREYTTPEQAETDHPELTRTLEDLLELRRQVREQQYTSPESWFAEGDLVIELDRLLRELADTSHTIHRTGTPPRLSTVPPRPPVQPVTRAAVDAGTQGQVAMHHSRPLPFRYADTGGGPVATIDVA